MIRPPTTTRKALAPGETAGTANRTKVAIQAAPVAAMAHPSPNTTVALVGDLDTCVDRLRRLWQLDIDRITFALLSGGREQRLAQPADTVIGAVEAEGGS